MMKYQIAIFVFAATFAHHSSAQQPHEQAALNMHNGYRAKHGSTPMALSTQLNQIATGCATEYVTRRIIDHKCKTKPGDVGENLYFSMGMGGDKTQSVNHAVQSWYNEVKNYNYNMPGNSQGVFEHFTQVVWDGSTQLGCGVATVGTNTVVCCLYKAQGNDYSNNYQFYKTNVKRPAM